MPVVKASKSLEAFFRLCDINSDIRQLCEKNGWTYSEMTVQVWMPDGRRTFVLIEEVSRCLKTSAGAELMSFGCQEMA